MESIVFPDAVEITINYLNAAHAALGDSTTRAGTRLASDDTRGVIITLVDAEIHSLVIQTSTLRFECWVDTGPLSQEQAQDLGQRTRGLVGAMQGTTQGGSTVYKVTDLGAGLADNPDQLSGKERYTFEALVSLRGQAIDYTTVLTDETGTPILVV